MSLSLGLLRMKWGSSLKNTLIKCYSTSESLTETTQVNGVRRITMNNPHKRNALSLDMLTVLHKDLTSNCHDQSLRCIVISGKGKVFSAGHDLKELSASSGTDSHKKIFAKCTELMLSITKTEVPVLAQVRGKGLAAAAGCQLAASCDIVIATENSHFSTPGAAVGIFCSTPGIALSRAVPQKMASYMLLTGNQINAQEALRSGLVSKVVSEESLEEETDRVIQSILTKSRSVVALGKAFYYKQLSLDLESAYKEGEKIMVENLTLSDAQTGISCFMNKAKPTWKHNNDKLVP